MHEVEGHESARQLTQNIRHLNNTAMHTNEFISIVTQNQYIRAILEHANSIGIPNWYLGAGCLSQSLWNHFHRYPLEQNISDYDLVYFDSSDISYETEDAYVKLAQSIFSDLSIQIDLKNQARVHLWYERKFGYKIRQYDSIEAAISSWPTTSTTIAITKQGNGRIKLYTAHGLQDASNMIVRPNKVQITKQIYLAKANKWKQYWPQLMVIDWDDA